MRFFVKYIFKSNTDNQSKWEVASDKFWSKGILTVKKGKGGKYTFEAIHWDGTKFTFFIEHLFTSSILSNLIYMRVCQFLFHLKNILNPSISLLLRQNIKISLSKLT